MYYLSAIIYTSMILDFNKLVNGSSLSLPAHGRAGARATPFLAALFAKQKTKFGGGGTPEAERFAFATGQEARAGKNSFPPTPFLFARPSENYQKSASGFSRKKVRILFRTDSQFVKFLFPASLGASPLASANEFSSNFQTSQSFFARRAKAKRQFSAQKRLQIKI
jgi:hypothetical protein